MTGKVTGNEGMAQRGQERQVGDHPCHKVLRD